MKTLLLLRHAKSSWDNADLADFERPLNDRGERAAPFMGKLIREKGLVPAVILSSPAVRARQTAVLVKESCDFDAGIFFEPRIYEASPHTLRDIISKLDDAHLSAMLVGHNPGIEGFIRYLTGTIEPMPTAALAVIELNISKWNEIDDGCGKLQNIFRPREEMGR